MPVSLSVKNVPDEVAERLRDQARLHKRSLQGELLAILEETLAPEHLSVDDLYTENEALGFSTPGNSLEMIRELRDSR